MFRSGRFVEFVVVGTLVLGLSSSILSTGSRLLHRSEEVASSYATWVDDVFDDPSLIPCGSFVRHSIISMECLFFALCTS